MSKERNYQFTDAEIIQMRFWLAYNGHEELAQNIHNQFLAHITNEEAYFGPENPDVIIEIPLEGTL
jgi:hypothetical protein